VVAGQYAGLVDFSTIHLARLIEQVILKSQLATGEKPKFFPSSTSFLYDKRVDTRMIVSEIKKKYLPFIAVGSDSTVSANQVNILAKTLVKKTNKRAYLNDSATGSSLTLQFVDNVLSTCYCQTIIGGKVYIC
jgi:hypothetical protein